MESIIKILYHDYFAYSDFQVFILNFISQTFFINQ